MNFIPISQPTLTELERKYLNDAFDSGWISSVGKYVDLFEENFAKFCGCRYAVAVGNGTVGLHLALVAAGIKQGDEVIVPDLTFVASANAIVHCGATPVFCDIDGDTLCIDPETILPRITSKTKAIMPVHLYGHPANMERILEIGKKYDLKIIEDAAEAHGAAIKGKKVGAWGDMGVFSFYGNKIITTGEGGMITTQDEETYTKLKFIRDHAMSKEKRYWHLEVGYNYRISNLQASIGVAQLERVESIIQKKRQIFTTYQKHLQSTPSIKLNTTAPGATHVYWMVCAEIEGLTESTRQILFDHLKKNNVDSRPYFYPVSDMPMYQRADTPVTHSVFAKGINLPTYFDLTDTQINHVCGVLLSGLKELGL